ncbi:hypothetical protein [Scleromatobacter humisilvae]|uniref:GST N-terminal domain-containing protein n=1 Tax=Scleromatobacter humisilvae TaxID=2897159 RepID=A0A9X1YN97_9BURK|nr:hypothetical protein [Scleromatobacter humisilvae]MCK9689399.1 hypothetical protein [Scleromatobacter humisilvae]
MNLYYATPPLFARRVRVLLRERGLLSRINEIAVASWDSPVELQPHLARRYATFAQGDAMQATAPH